MVYMAQIIYMAHMEYLSDSLSIGPWLYGYARDFLKLLASLHSHEWTYFWGTGFCSSPNIALRVSGGG